MEKNRRLFWDNYNESLINEYIKLKSQHLQEEVLPDLDIKELTEMLEVKNIVLYNDEVNTFDYVVECLSAFCDHEELQAEQCALIVHNNGKCSVLSGNIKELKPIASILSKYGLTVEIE
tara:strand:- start:54 stop:410 length:357 start_codon:yes stop_codon:yes gene_type:complete